MAGYGVPAESEIGGPEPDSSVKVIGWRNVPSKRKPHLVYTILAAAPSAGSKSVASEARLVQRRYRDFEKMYRILLPRAKEASIILPSLPSKFTFGRSQAVIGVERQRLLHEWLRYVVAHPLLWCDELRVFLGLPPGDDINNSTSDMDQGNISDEGTQSVTSEKSEHPTTSCASEMESPFAVDLAELEMKALYALECMMQDREELETFSTGYVAWSDA